MGAYRVMQRFRWAQDASRTSWGFEALEVLSSNAGQAQGHFFIYTRLAKS